MNEKDFSISKELGEKYENHYNDFDPTWRQIGSINKAKNIVELCSKIPHDRVLEIGSGDGTILEQLDNMGFSSNLYSLEISNSAVELIKSKNINSVQFYGLFDGINTPFENKSFDLVILSHVVEHLEFPRILLKEAARVGEYVFVEVPLEDNFRMDENYLGNEAGHINFYNPKTIRRLLQTCNLKIDEQTVTNPSMDAYKYESGVIGILKYIIKEACLRLSSQFATSIFTYHCSIRAH